MIDPSTPNAAEEHAADAPQTSPSSESTPVEPVEPAEPAAPPAGPLPATRFALQVGQTVVLMGRDGKKLMLKVEAKGSRGTHYGQIDLGGLVGRRIGDVVNTSTGTPFHILLPTLEDYVMGLKRATQIIYPKDIGPILMKLGLSPGATVIESGGGSGALTSAMAWAVSPGGMVYSFDRAAAHQKRARNNLTNFGLAEAVTFELRDVQEEGFPEGPPVDAVFLDLKDVAGMIPEAAKRLQPGCVLGCLVPTTNQVSAVINALERGPFADIDITETMYRNFKPNSARLRPYDRMVGHTGYLIFARRVRPLPIPVPKVKEVEEIAGAPSETDDG